MIATENREERAIRRVARRRSLTVFQTVRFSVQQSATPFVRFGALFRQIDQTTVNTVSSRIHAVVMHVCAVVAKCR